MCAQQQNLLLQPCMRSCQHRHALSCCGAVQDKWSAAYSVRTVLLSIQSLLGEPNNDSPLNPYAAKVCAAHASHA